ncbi:MAG: S-adenosyl-L-homocysteine hydrolase [Candidatus Bathyarchaeota archaeon BA1]|nr:MAG: S-adenosyl-L-homocysteine hydrolase [Candidatus Bathyarchaeota archaeon BA1]
MPESLVRDMALASMGRDKLEWVEGFMPVLSEIRRELEREKPLEGLTIGLCLHLEAKTAVLARTLAAGGARVVITSCNPQTSQDDVAAAATDFAHVYAWRGETASEYVENLRRVLGHNPDILIDDGADLICMLHEERRDLLGRVIGGCEETTTGVIRLRNMEREGKLAFPVIAVNDAQMKYLIDNRYGTGESSLFGILNATNLTMAGKTVVVAGYGWVGQGVAKRARGMGARVILTEVDPIKAFEAHMEGFHVMRMADAIKEAEIVITATGMRDVVRKEHLEVAKDGCILCNAGHFNVEISIPDLESLSVDKKPMREFGIPYGEKLVWAYRLRNGRKLFLLGGGRLVNLVCGQGHAAEIMDLSFALQAESVRLLVRKRGKLRNKVYRVPPEVDERVARLKLKSLGVHIDTLTKGQRKYRMEWRFKPSGIS